MSPQNYSLPTDKEFFLKIELCNQKGLHARAAAKFVKLAESFDSEVFVEKEGVRVVGKSLMSLMMLAAGYKTPLIISAIGKDAKESVLALVDLIERRFDEPF